MFPNINLSQQQGEPILATIHGGSSQIWCNFIVDSTNGNGLGIRSLKTNAAADKVLNVFMHTSASPLSGNPNPAAGNIIVQLALPYAGYVNGTSGYGAPLSGSVVNVTSGLTQFALYVIVSVGTTTLTQWQTLGLPVGVTPAVGATFIAATASAGSGTGAVELASATGPIVGGIVLVGDPNTTCNVASGALIYCQTFAATNSSTTTLALTNPPDGTVIGMTFNMIPVPGPQI
jgi:hypothetical protein